MSMIHLKVRNLTKSFSTKTVLDSINLDVFQGESLVILGGSGTGKSVLIKTILGLLTPDKGDIYYQQTLIDYKNSYHHPIRQNSSMLFQGGALFDSLPIWHNIMFKALYEKTLSKSQAKEKAVHLLKQVGLSSDIIDLFPAELSGGMQKRVALARAIASKPKIIFFDEPTTGLDPIMSNRINQLIKNSVQSLKATAVTITHDMNSVDQIADRVAFLHEGKVAWIGSHQEMKNTSCKLLYDFIHGYSA